MGNKLIIIGVTGANDARLIHQLTEQLCKAGLSVRHASSRHDGDGLTTFATGGPEDLQADLAGAGIKVALVPGDAGTAKEEGKAAPGVTLETVNANVIKVLEVLGFIGSVINGGVPAPKSVEDGGRKKKKGGEVMIPNPLPPPLPVSAPAQPPTAPEEEQDDGAAGEAQPSSEPAPAEQKETGTQPPVTTEESSEG